MVFFHHRNSKEYPEQILPTFTILSNIKLNGVISIRWYFEQEYKYLLRFKRKIKSGGENFTVKR